jgi:hypothetical protein
MAGMGAQGGGPFPELRKNINAAVFIAQLWSRPVEAWLLVPGTAGEMHFGISALVGMIFMPFFGILGCDPRKEFALQLMMLFWGTTFPALFAQRISHLKLRKSGYWPHSLYSGRPWLPGNEVTVKQFGMPVFTGIVAFLVASVSPILGAYLGGAAFCMFVTWRISCMAEEAEMRNLRDAWDHQQTLAQRMRERGWR